MLVALLLLALLAVLFGAFTTLKFLFFVAAGLFLLSLIFGYSGGRGTRF